MRGNPARSPSIHRRACSSGRYHAHGRSFAALYGMHGLKPRGGRHGISFPDRGFQLGRIIGYPPQTLREAGPETIRSGYWPPACYELSVSAHAIKPDSGDMRATWHVPLRYIHPGSANFTLPIRKKPMSPSVIPLTLNKTSSEVAKHEMERMPRR